MGVVVFCIIVVIYIWASISEKVLDAKLVKMRAQKPLIDNILDNIPDLPPLPQVEDYYAPGADIFPEPPEQIEAEPAFPAAKVIEFLNNVAKIECQDVETTIAPNVLTIHIELENPMHLSKVKKAVSAMSADFNLDIMQVESKIAHFALSVPRTDREKVYFKNVMETREFQEISAKPNSLPAVVGYSVENKPVVMDIGKAVHMVCAGQTGSGKSSAVNSILLSMIASRTPKQLQLVLIDPKQAEFTPLEGLPHLKTFYFAPELEHQHQGFSKHVITDVREAVTAMRLLVNEMERRNSIMAQLKVRELDENFPYIMVCIDEMADLMMTADKQFGNDLIRILQKGRAVKFRVLCATQLPNKDVLPGLMRANIPSRLALKTATATDSRILLERAGCEKLMEYGDGIFRYQGKEVRVQAALSTDEDVKALVDYYS